MHPPNGFDPRARWPPAGRIRILLRMDSHAVLAAITSRHQASSEVMVLELVGISKALPPYEPGAHVDVQTPAGWRQYSLCRPWTGDGRYRIAVKREATGRGGSRWLHERTAAGDTLRIRAPRSQFRLAADAERHCLLAAGIGITPLFAMAQSLWASGSPFELAYFSRGRREAAFGAAIRRAPWAASATLHFDDEPHHQVDLPAFCRRQRLGTHFYSCGPAGFMAAVRRAVADRAGGVLHEERFGATCDAGAICEAGFCGSCVTRVLEGEPIHGDSCLSESQRRTHMAWCCGAARSAHLMLDL